MRISTSRAVFIYCSNFMLAMSMYYLAWEKDYRLAIVGMLSGLVYRIIGEGFVEK